MKPDTSHVSIGAIKIVMREYYSIQYSIEPTNWSTATADAGLCLFLERKYWLSIPC